MKGTFKPTCAGFFLLSPELKTNTFLWMLSSWIDATTQQFPKPYSCDRAEVITQWAHGHRTLAELIKR